MILEDFSHFFVVKVPDDFQAEVDEDTQVLLTADFEIGHYIRERIVPRAILFLSTGKFIIIIIRIVLSAILLFTGNFL